MLWGAIQDPDEAALALLGDTDPHVLRPDHRTVLADIRNKIFEYELHNITGSCGKTLIVGG